MISSNILDNITATDNIKAKVGLFDGSTLVTICTCEDRLQGLTIERMGQKNKFFGFGVIHKITLNLIDMERELNITQNYHFKVMLGYGNQFIQPFPLFYAKEISRDETTNTITVVAYDKLYEANEYTVNDLGITAPYTVSEFENHIAEYLGLQGVSNNTANLEARNTNYELGANFEGTESLKRALDAIADITQTIYYLNRNELLVFKQLDISGEPVLDISREVCYDINSGDTFSLATITNTDELNDSTSVTIGEGYTQFIRDNEFLETVDAATLLNILEAAKSFCGITATNFICRWDGNILLEIGDKISLHAEDDSEIISYLVNESIVFDGYLESNIEWNCEADNETAENPTSLGEKINQTFAKIDKANKEITLVVSDVNDIDKTINGEEGIISSITQIKLDTNSIESSVTAVENKTISLEDAYGNLSDQLVKIEQNVSTKVDNDSFDIKVNEKLSNGVDEIQISETGFTFNRDGLTIDKTDSEMTTNINEDGLSVFKNSEEVLTADNAGVQAKNLHATTYLIVGNNTYFADYGTNRAGCFWTGK